MTKSFLLAVTAAFLATSSIAAGPVTVLGVPLDQPLKPAPKACPENTDNARSICWVDRPYIAKDGSRLGMLHLPNKDVRPTWATNAVFDVYAAKDGSIRSLKATVFSPSKHEIARSISARFGLPQQTSLAGPNPSSAEWNHADAHVDLFCYEDRCTVQFRSSLGQAEYVKEMAERRERRERDARKPVAP